MSGKITNRVETRFQPRVKSRLFNLKQFAFLLALAASFPAAADLPEPVRAALAGAGLPEDAIGVVVRRVADGKTLLAHRDDASMQPASTLKLVTSLAAIETLGPGYRARTQLLATGDVVDGVLKGDLILRGGGDVDLDWEAFERMLVALRLTGVREIRGDFVLDLSRFQPARTDVGLPPFDETPEFRYNVVPDALLLNTYLVRLDMTSVGESFALKSTPLLDKVAFAADFKFVDRRCEDWEDGWKLPALVNERGDRLVVKLQGEYPRDCAANTEINVLDRVVFADRLFRSLWAAQGGKFRGHTLEGTAPANARVVAEHRSRPFSEVLRTINKHSDNPIARVTYLTLGANAAGDVEEPTAKRAERVVRAWLAQRGIEVQGLVLENGSGLSRTERIRPRDLASVLEAGRQSRWAPEFMSSLPIAAIDNGMAKRLKESPAAERARLKTGTLRDVSAVAGYVNDAQGGQLIVVAMINHPLAEGRIARPVLDVLVDWIARHEAWD
jgi:D-alanyl-D-alanine carboxypeptidase/D-alanyl-D-alanine-endopeptidase (penicillin-binding protein 4)